MPSIMGSSVGAGQMGSTRHGIAEGIAAGQLGQDFSRRAADMRMQGWGQQLQMAPQMMNAYGQSQMQPYEMMQDIGGQQQGMNQAQINAAKDRWDFDQNAIGDKLGQAIGMLTGTGAGSYGRTSSSGSSGKF